VDITLFVSESDENDHRSQENDRRKVDVATSRNPAGSWEKRAPIRATT